MTFLLHKPHLVKVTMNGKRGVKNWPRGLWMNPYINGRYGLKRGFLGKGSSIIYVDNLLDIFDSIHTLWTILLDKASNMLKSLLPFCALMVYGWPLNKRLRASTTKKQIRTIWDISHSEFRIQYPYFAFLNYLYTVYSGLDRYKASTGHYTGM